MKRAIDARAGRVYVLTDAGGTHACAVQRPGAQLRTADRPKGGRRCVGFNVMLASFVIAWGHRPRSNTRTLVNRRSPLRGWRRRGRSPDGGGTVGMNEFLERTSVRRRDPTSEPYCQQRLMPPICSRARRRLAKRYWQWPRRVARRDPEPTSQTLRVQSSDAEINRRMSTAQATQLTSPVCPFRRLRTHSPVDRRQILAVRSEDTRDQATTVIDDQQLENLLRVCGEGSRLDTIRDAPDSGRSPSASSRD